MRNKSKRRQHAGSEILLFSASPFASIFRPMSEGRSGRLAEICRSFRRQGRALCFLKSRKWLARRLFRPLSEPLVRPYARCSQLILLSLSLYLALSLNLSLYLGLGTRKSDAKSGSTQKNLFKNTNRIDPAGDVSPAKPRSAIGSKGFVETGLRCVWSVSCSNLERNGLFLWWYDATSSSRGKKVLNFQLCH